MSKTFEESRRNAKAGKMAEVLVSFGISAEKARLLNDMQWIAVAAIAECRPPNSEQTRNAVYSAMLDKSAESNITVRKWREMVEAQCAATVS